ncbi:uncharacterized protein LOC109822994 [Asparagus officinalis]|uniref:uncharacterized protein LOC109822994 n=1 Tax=Asparagus officinalis TaxID=4686 RepID=UPI00098E2ACB|nr:uncharacterized protein LOC109822994 [Asparagus officinalis]
MRKAAEVMREGEGFVEYTGEDEGYKKGKRRRNNLLLENVDQSFKKTKVLNLGTDGASRSFDTDCQPLRMVHHRNLVRINDTCSKLDFKALVLQFLSNGSLEGFQACRRWVCDANHTGLFDTVDCNLLKDE